MKATYVILVSALCLFPAAAMAQKWEVGGVGGGSFYTSNDVNRGSNSVKASFSPGFAAGFVLGQDMGRRWGGEIRYTYLRNSAKLEGNTAKATFGAQSHVINYDFLLYFSPSGSRARPFLSFGAGIKHHTGSGPEAITQPLFEYALLTKTTDTTPTASVGFGVKFRVGDTGSFRVEVKDYISPVPTKIIVPNRGASLSGWMHNFVPMVGISYLF
ncbi:MAG TPA: outer membrane beta-barrel protein [Bryobacteraceae bacterium]|nr:outer membrane beta-barrel protein [Bryobacteraceae bacterium]